MRAVMMYGPGDVRVEDRPDPGSSRTTDAIIRLAATCVCGSDLWPYRGADPITDPLPMGHEYVGVVEEVGAAVAHREAGRLRRRLLLRLRQHLRDLRLRATRAAASTPVSWARSARRQSSPASRWPTAPWSPRPGQPDRGPGARPARRLRRAGHRLVRRRARRGRPRQDRGRRRRRCRRAARRPRRATPRRGAHHRGQPPRRPPATGHDVRRHRHRHRARRRRGRRRQGAHRRARRALGDRGGRHAGVDDAGDPLDPPRWARRLRRRLARRLAAR